MLLEGSFFSPPVPHVERSNNFRFFITTFFFILFFFLVRYDFFSFVLGVFFFLPVFLCRVAGGLYLDF